MQNNTEETINEGSDLVIIINLHLDLNTMMNISPFHALESSSLDSPVQARIAF